MSIFFKVFVRCRPLCLVTSRASSCKSATRYYTVGPLYLENSYSGIQKYRDLERYFKRRLRAVGAKYSADPQDAMVQGYDHIYYAEGDGIYRMDTKQGHSNPEKVLCLGLDSCGDEAWSLQRVRLSPGEKMLAALVKTPDREECRCVLVRVGDCPEPLLILDKVFSFEWATDDVLFYTSQEGLQCHRVFRLELSSTGHRTSLLYQEEQPE